MRKCRIGTAKFFTLLLLLYRTSVKADGTVTIDYYNAVNYLYVKIPGKYNIKAGDEFELSMKEFTVTNDDGTTTDWIMAVVTCKAVENK